MRVWVLALLAFFKPVMASNVVQDLDRIAGQIPANMSFSMIVESLEDHTVIWAKNADQERVPASTVKLVTALSSLSVLGPAWRWHTRLWQQGDVKHGTLKGDLWLQMTGDPTLLREDLLALFAQLKASGVRRISNHVWIDIDAYDRDFRSSGWAWEDLLEGYAVPVSAGIINGNAFAVAVDAQSKSMPFRMRPDFAGQLTSSLKWVDSRKRPEHCHWLKTGGDGNHYHFSGCASLPKMPYTMNLAVWDVPFYLEKNIESVLKQVGIEVQKGVALASIGQRAKGRIVAKHASAPLIDLIAVMLKESDNLVAQSLFKSLALVDSDQSASWIAAKKAVRRILFDHYQLSLPDVVDGAGVSMYNRLSVHQQINVLRLLCERFGFLQHPDLWLSVMGVDGTLENRLVHTSLKGHFFAKTGSLSGVASVVGLMSLSSGKHYLVAIQLQGRTQQAKKFLIIEDDLLQTLFKSLQHNA